MQRECVMLMQRATERDTVAAQIHWQAWDFTPILKLVELRANRHEIAPRLLVHRPQVVVGGGARGICRVLPDRRAPGTSLARD
ncbi:hypothetical protein ACQPXH_05065 [Nocardia sp. CA-135953]|uniref:hypothetical protein n=1 Tax=Nocardia sp. CA-135953 TaxID=3239978 RepID=UPI003D979FEF